MEVCTLASGSSGNAAVVTVGGTHVLLDAGISCRRITTALKELGIPPEKLSAVLITHEHTDHISGLATLTKHLRLPVYAAAPTLRQLCYRIPFLEDLCRPVTPGEGVEIGGIWAEAFATSHDAAASVGYTLTGNGHKMALATDLGYVSQGVLDAVAGAELVICETNHDEDWLRTGPYPYYLKQRVLGDRGHLSNEAGAELAAFAVEQGARSVLLAHLSNENNTPAHALEVVRRRMRAGGVDPDRDITLTVAPRSDRGRVFCLEKEGAGC